MNNKIKLVVCDIDGTLVSTDRIMSDYTVNILNKILDANIKLSIASGRPVDELKERYKSWNLNRPFDFIIGMNGAQSYDERTKEFKRDFLLDCETIERLFIYMRPWLVDCRPSMYLDGKIYSDNKTNTIIKSGQRANKDVVIVDNLAKFWAQANDKIMFRTNEETMEKLEKYISQNPCTEMGFKAVKTQSTMMEFVHPNVDKKYPLLDYMNKYNLNKDEVLVAGDNSNDDGMLSVVENSVCLSNGNDHTKNICKYITKYDNDNDGLAQFLEEFIFKN